MHIAFKLQLRLFTIVKHGFVALLTLLVQHHWSYIAATFQLYYRNVTILLQHCCMGFNQIWKSEFSSFYFANFEVCQCKVVPATIILYKNKTISVVKSFLDHRRVDEALFKFYSYNF